MNPTTTAGPTVFTSLKHISTDTTWGPLGSPYIIRGGLFIDSNISLTLLPGTIVKIDGQLNAINVDGQLLSLGTPQNHVTITSYKDDSIGGDSNGDGSASTP